MAGLAHVEQQEIEPRSGSEGHTEAERDCSPAIRADSYDSWLNLFRLAGPKMAQIETAPQRLSHNNTSQCVRVEPSLGTWVYLWPTSACSFARERFEDAPTPGRIRDRRRYATTVTTSTGANRTGASRRTRRQHPTGSTRRFCRCLHCVLAPLPCAFVPLCRCAVVPLRRCVISLLATAGYWLLCWLLGAVGRRSCTNPEPEHCRPPAGRTATRRSTDAFTHMPAACSCNSRARNADGGTFPDPRGVNGFAHRQHVIDCTRLNCRRIVNRLSLRCKCLSAVFCLGWQFLARWLPRGRKCVLYSYGSLHPGAMSILSCLRWQLTRFPSDLSREAKHLIFVRVRCNCREAFSDNDVLCRRFSVS